jgi:hypothetical protein
MQENKSSNNNLMREIVVHYLAHETSIIISTYNTLFEVLLMINFSRLNLNLLYRNREFHEKGVSDT